MMFLEETQKKGLCAPFIVSNESTGLSLGMVASPQCQLPFRPAQIIVHSAASCRLNFRFRNFDTLRSNKSLTFSPANLANRQAGRRVLRRCGGKRIY
jgi:hypothetical protein